MPSEASHHRYFQAKEGHWRGRIRFVITDPGGLRASSVRWADKSSFCALSLASRLSGLVMRTTVDYAKGRDRNEVRHTTKVSNFVMPVYRSAESIYLGEDGLSFQVEGREAFFPFLRRRAWAATGEVATDHGGAFYRIPVLGLAMEQETRMTADGLQVIQRTAFTRAEILLKWQRPLKKAASGEHQTTERGR